jgi:hypothetical protein
MPKMLELNCLVSGDDRGHIFTVKIKDSEKVSALKKAIKVEKQVAFQHADADALVLWGVSMAVNESLEGIVRNFGGGEPLSPIEKLSKVFSNVDDTHLHIVVRRPLGACEWHSGLIALPNFPVITRPGVSSEPPLILELNCLVLGESHTHIFPVKIAGTESVGALKDAIKDKKKPAFDHVPADTLILWRVFVPDDDSLKEQLSRLDLVDESSLSPMQELSEVFSDPPIQRHLHIIVKPPPLGEFRWLVLAGRLTSS